MKTISICAIYVSILLLAGCAGGPRVVDNQYDSAGFPKYIVSSEMKYIGSPSIPSFHKVMSDIFIKDVDGVVVEVVEIRRKQANSRYRVLPMEGPLIILGGKEYVEKFFYVMDRADAIIHAQFIEKQGYKFDGRMMVGRSLLRKVNVTNGIIVSYGCSEALLPDGLPNDEEAFRNFLRKKYAEKISLPDVD